MKKFLTWMLVLICLAALILLVFFIKNKQKYEFGHFAKKIELKYTPQNEILLPNNSILFLGSRKLDCPDIIYPSGAIQETTHCKQKQIFENPFELYKPKTNKITTLGNIKDYLYKPEGVLLDNNRILLIYAYNPNNDNYPIDDTAWEYRFCLDDTKKHWATCKDQAKYFKPPYVYDSMIVVNLDTMKVEKEIKKKINETNMINPYSTGFALLDNDKLLIIDAEDKIGEVYDFETDTSKVLKDLKMDIDSLNTIIATRNGRALIFGSKVVVPNDNSSKQSDLLDVYEYDDNTGDIKPVGKVMWRYKPIIKKASEDKVIILGGKIERPGALDFNVQEIEIYNLKTNESNIVARMPEGRCFLQYRGNSFNGAMIDDKHFLIAGGQTCNYPFVRYYKTPLVFNLEDYSFTETMDLPYEMSELQMVSLDGGGALMVNGLKKYNKQILIFKTWRGR